jgi:amidohydrolase
VGGNTFNSSTLFIFTVGISIMVKKKIRELAQDIHGEVVTHRRYLHAHPELSFQEFGTSQYVKAQLDSLGIPWKSAAGTGILATIMGKGSGKVIALRADMDALPIQEMNEVSYSSQNPGVMHACGHDFHTSSLLGTARILNTIRDQFNGTVKLLFQPGEEVLPGGASLMINDKVLENPAPQEVVGQHAMPSLEAGKVGIRAGKFMASMDALSIRIKGRGGHGAIPEQNIDPVVIASHVVIALQQVVSRMASPREPTVLSIGKVIANGAVNVIPDEVYMEGTFRAMNETWRSEAHKRMVTMAKTIAESMGATCEFEITRGYPFLINEAKLTGRVWDIAVDYLGVANVVEPDSWMAAEDFAYYSQVADSCFYLCGTGNASRGITSALHTPTFDIDEDALRVSTGLMAHLAVMCLRA